MRRNLPVFALIIYFHLLRCFLDASELFLADQTFQALPQRAHSSNRAHYVNFIGKSHLCLLQELVLQADPRVEALKALLNYIWDFLWLEQFTYQVSV